MAATTYRTLLEHPNSAEICDVRNRAATLTDAELSALAAGWRDSLDIASARAAALSADTPLVLDALGAFDALAEVFADDLAGKPWAAALQTSLVRIALKAIRDAIAAAYAQPVLHPKQHAALMAPWRAVFPDVGAAQPDLGPRAAEVTRVLQSLALMGGRCHDETAAAAFDRALSAVRRRDEDFAAPARAEAWSAAVLTGRRRTRTVLRRAARESLTHRCAVCGTRPDPDDVAADRVLALAADATDALLVADAIDVTMLEILVLPMVPELDTH